MLERPFYIITVFWGERFRRYFLDMLLPSLLWPGNLPALRTRHPSKLLIATTAEDWELIKADPIWMRVHAHVEVECIKIPPCPPDKSGCEHMGIGHALATHRAYRDGVYATILSPDCVVADGGFAYLQKQAEKGFELVVAAAVRFGEEPFLFNLSFAGAMSNGRLRETPVPPRQMVVCALDAMHSELKAYKWNEPGFIPLAPAAWWEAPGGIVLHSLSWSPVLIDYKAVARQNFDHDISTFQDWTLDGDYLYKNGQHLRTLVVRDSDHFFHVSWGPLTDRPLMKRTMPGGHTIARYQFAWGFRSHFFDPLKRQWFRRIVRWHFKTVGEDWKPAEAEAITALDRCGLLYGLRPLFTLKLYFYGLVVRPFVILYLYPDKVWARIKLALRGDAVSRRLIWNYTKVWSR